ncbi:uncharacterized protein LOC110866404 [Helianthus annuus]|uniref:uncharacterized protein LOC110866404 n=1 Tax=Helianthus annuus TaxID=4232 RepID=UPI000B8F9441|nr:uncharacterized protein LOC110866404 [Helianthus annuus]
MEPKIHPAATVTNIKSLIPVVLEMESGQYASWSELFKIQCRANLVIDHLSPKPAASSSSSGTSTDADKAKEKEPDESWDRLDAIVLQWIYATISNDLLHTILKPNTTAYDAWKTLESLFQDNKSSRAIHLMHNPTHALTDSLASRRLNEQYEGIATILQQQDPLPSFYEARSKIMLVETRKAEQALLTAQTAGTALNANTTKSQPPANNTEFRPEPDRYRGRGRSRGRGRGRGSWGRGRHNNYSQQPTTWPTQQTAWPNSAPQQQWAGSGSQQPFSTPAWTAQQPSFWTPPPCPYPTAPRPTSATNHGGNGLLGPRPTQA